MEGNFLGTRSPNIVTRHASWNGRLLGNQAGSANQRARAMSAPNERFPTARLFLFKKRLFLHSFLFWKVITS